MAPALRDGRGSQLPAGMAARRLPGGGARPPGRARIATCPRSCAAAAWFRVAPALRDGRGSQPGGPGVLACHLHGGARPPGRARIATGSPPATRRSPQPWWPPSGTREDRNALTRPSTRPEPEVAPVLRDGRGSQLPVGGASGLHPRVALALREGRGPLRQLKQVNSRTVGCRTYPVPRSPPPTRCARPAGMYPRNPSSVRHQSVSHSTAHYR